MNEDVEDVIGGLFVLAIVIALGWVVAIVFGVRFATSKGYSPHRMWFGIHPILGWIAWFVLACLPRRVQCSSCGGFIGKQFRICPYCHNNVVPEPFAAG